VVTDFCDPGKKIIIDFPNVFWHNYDPRSEFLKEEQLPSEGWVIIKVLQKNPTIDIVDLELRKYKEKGVLVF